VTGFGRYGPRTRQASNLVTCSSRKRGAGLHTERCVGARWSCRRYFCFARQCGAETDGITRWLSRSCNAFGQRGREVRLLGSRRAIFRQADLTIRSWHPAPSGCSSLRGAEFLSRELGRWNMGKRFQSLLLRQRRQRVLESHQGGELAAHLHLEGCGSPSLGWLGPCRSNHRSQQWLTASELQIRRPAHDSHGPLRCASELPGAPLITAWWRSRERALRWFCRRHGSPLGFRIAQASGESGGFSALERGSSRKREQISARRLSGSSRKSRAQRATENSKKSHDVSTRWWNSGNRIH